MRSFTDKPMGFASGNTARFWRITIIESVEAAVKPTSVLKRVAEEFDAKYIISITYNRTKSITTYVTPLMTCAAGLSIFSNLALVDIRLPFSNGECRN